MNRYIKGQHTHSCTVADCRNTVACDGILERNYDGFPDVICSDYHLSCGTVAEMFCDEHLHLADEAHVLNDPLPIGEARECLDCGESIEECRCPDEDAAYEFEAGK